jgi:hypothetical protein
MYGTIARLHLKPGAEAELDRLNRQDIPAIAGHVFEYVYRSEADPLDVWLVVAFESKAAYVANATSPAQHERYQQYRDLMTAEPEWHDGEILFSYPT